MMIDTATHTLTHHLTNIQAIINNMVVELHLSQQRMQVITQTLAISLPPLYQCLSTNNHQGPSTSLINTHMRGNLFNFKLH